MDLGLGTLTASPRRFGGAHERPDVPITGARTIRGQVFTQPDVTGRCIAPSNSFACEDTTRDEVVAVDPYGCWRSRRNHCDSGLRHDLRTTELRTDPTTH